MANIWYSLYCYVISCSTISNAFCWCLFAPKGREVCLTAEFDFRHRLELMRDIYNEDLSPDTPEAKQNFFQCLAGCGPSQNYFNFINLIPSRSAPGCCQSLCPKILFCCISCFCTSSNVGYLFLDFRLLFCIWVVLSCLLILFVLCKCILNIHFLLVGVS